MRSLDPSRFTPDDFISERARGAYTAAVSRPDASFAFSTTSQVTKPDASDVKLIKKSITLCKDRPSNDLKFVPLDLASVAICVCVR